MQYFLTGIMTSTAIVLTLLFLQTYLWKKIEKRKQQSLLLALGVNGAIFLAEVWIAFHDALTFEQWAIGIKYVGFRAVICFISSFVCCVAYLKWIDPYLTCNAVNPLKMNRNTSV